MIPNEYTEHDFGFGHLFWILKKNIVLVGWVHLYYINWISICYHLPILSLWKITISHIFTTTNPTWFPIKNPRLGPPTTHTLWLFPGGRAWQVIGIARAGPTGGHTLRLILTSQPFTHGIPAVFTHVYGFIMNHHESSWIIINHHHHHHHHHPHPHPHPHPYPLLGDGLDGHGCTDKHKPSTAFQNHQPVTVAVPSWSAWVTSYGGDMAAYTWEFSAAKGTDIACHKGLTMTRMSWIL